LITSARQGEMKWSHAFVILFFFIQKLLIKFNQPYSACGIHHIYMYEINSFTFNVVSISMLIKIQANLYVVVFSVISLIVKLLYFFFLKNFEFTPILLKNTLRGPVNIPDRPRYTYNFFISPKQRKTTKILLK
jgi:hypothetical protein